MAVKFIEIADSCCSKWATENNSFSCQNCGKRFPPMRDHLIRTVKHNPFIFMGNIQLNMPYFVKWESGYVSGIDQGIEVEYENEGLKAILQKISKLLPEFRIFERQINGLNLRSILFSLFENETWEKERRMADSNLFTSCKIKSIQGHGTTITFCQNYLGQNVQEEMTKVFDSITEMCLVRFQLSGTTETYYKFELFEFFQKSFPHIEKRPIHYHSFRGMKIYEFTDQVSSIIEHKIKIDRENSNCFAIMLMLWEFLEFIFWAIPSPKFYIASIVWAIASCMLHATFVDKRKNTFICTSVQINIVARIMFIFAIILYTLIDLRDSMKINSGNTIFVEFAGILISDHIGKFILLLGIYVGKFTLTQLMDRA